jgi:protein-disulfide isomerase
VKFNDWQCPSCKAAFYAYKPILQKYEEMAPGAVKYVTKDFPLNSRCNFTMNSPGHAAACEAAAAVIMARAKGTVEQMEDWLFTHQGPPILTPEQVKDAARDVGGITDFDAQYLTALKEIRDDAALGTQLKVSSTPTFFINGRRLPQTLPPQYLNVILEAELKRP